MSYRQQFIHAVNRSAELGLLNKAEILPLNPKPISTKKLKKYYDASLFFLTSPEMGIHGTDQLVGLCGLTHLLLAKFLNGAGLPCEVTMGEFHWNREPFLPHASMNQLLEELDNPQHDSDIAFHCWLTLPDGSVMDWTINGDISKVASHHPFLPIDKAMIHISANEHDPDHYYAPMLVGGDYLRRIKAVPEGM